MTQMLKKNDQILIPNAYVAKKFFERFLGLMGRKNIDPKFVIIFPHCNSIHTFFMREAIDVIFVSANGVVVKTICSLKPWRLLLPEKQAVHCIEMASYNSKNLGICEGDLLKCEGIF